MRIFVAGATGAVGRALIPALHSAGHDVTGMSLMGASDFDVARVIGIVDATVDVPAAQPTLGRPRVEGVASLPRQNGSNNDLHGSLHSAI